MNGELLRRDVHPGEVALPDGRVLTRARVFITSHRLIAWREVMGGGVERALDVPLAKSYSVEARHGTLPGALEVELADGTAYVNRGAGCGCGSALLALAPPVGWTG